MTSVDSSSTDTVQWHGTNGSPSWALPTCVCHSDKISRPKYGSIPASEYKDADDVLDAKIDMLLGMMMEAKQMCVYTGAGISTAAGVPDYASVDSKSVMKKHMTLEKGSYRTAKPTVAHRTIAALEKKGLVHHWLQQNHDGLAQKAGFPFEKLNEIHGSWYDDTNPVVKMTGNLRSDLYAWMEEWSEKADCVLAMGTSFSGMSADSVATMTAKRFLREGAGQGLIIVNLQHTQQDHIAQLRIYSTCDEVMGRIAKKLSLKLDTLVYPGARMPPKPTRSTSSGSTGGRRSRSNSTGRK